MRSCGQLAPFIRHAIPIHFISLHSAPLDSGSGYKRASGDAARVWFALKAHRLFALAHVAAHGFCLPQPSCRFSWRLIKVYLLHLPMITTRAFYHLHPHHHNNSFSYLHAPANTHCTYLHTRDAAHTRRWRARPVGRHQRLDPRRLVDIQHSTHFLRFFMLAVHYQRRQKGASLHTSTLPLPAGLVAMPRAPHAATCCGYHPLLATHHLVPTCRLAVWQPY